MRKINVRFLHYLEDAALSAKTLMRRFSKSTMLFQLRGRLGVGENLDGRLIKK